MYLKWTSELIKYLGNQEHTIEEVLTHVVLRTMAPLQATSAFISVLDNQNSIVTVGKIGISSEVTASYEEKFTLTDRIPITDALRQRKIVVVDSLPTWPADYPLLSEIPYPTDEVSMISFPIERCGTPIAVGTVFFSSEFILDGEKNIFIESIANLLSLYLFSPGFLHGIKTRPPSAHVANHLAERGLPLSQRQELILRMISEGRTNLAIGEMLKYSESTIRQETIRIFSKLGCDGRVEASHIYKVQESEKLLTPSFS
jgi:DNA-binding CsgD family transcriptional regulator